MLDRKPLKDVCGPRFGIGEPAEGNGYCVMMLAWQLFLQALETVMTTAHSTLSSSAYGTGAWQRYLLSCSTGLSSSKASSL